MTSDAIRKIVGGDDLSSEETYELFAEMMDGRTTDVQKSALLVALKMKGESTEEIVGAARAMRERVVPIVSGEERLVDTCGTGGDAKGTFNVSTVAAFVAAGAGVKVAKHGNRAVSSKCGSADLLAALGLNLDLDAAEMSRMLEEIGIAFLFAPKLHPAMAAVGPVRRELGMRTIFNLLGPLTNPAAARCQVLGVYSREVLGPMAEALAELGSEHVLVVHSLDGMDEISVCSETEVHEVIDGGVREFTVSPEELGLRRCRGEEIPGGDVDANRRIALQVLDGMGGAAREIVLANAGAAIYVSGIAATLREGVEAARESIDSGAAREKLQRLARATQSVRGAA
jgi:anthranilate phosphoribosyltransferase